MTGIDAHLLLASARHPLGHALAGGLNAARVPHGARVLLAVSGGADSMALLALAAGLAQRGRIAPVAAHVDHGLRPESASEGDTVVRLALRCGVPVLRLAVQLERGANLSARARRARYSALADAAREHACDWVATAHHADDQVETMLMAFARGTGLSRMAGMKASRALTPDIRLVRPLLTVPRRELHAACSALHVAWCEDPTNADTSRPRGVVRHTVLPQLERTWPGTTARSAHASALLQWAARTLRHEVRALEATAGITDGFSRAVLRKAPLPVVAALIRKSVGPKCDGAVVWQIARAVRDRTTRVRTWRITPRRQVRLTASLYSSSSGALRQRL